MLVYKQRTKPVELLMMEALNLRMAFSGEEKLQLLNLQRGYEGEHPFDQLLVQSGFNGIVLNDLAFNENGPFQIDSLLLTGDRILRYDMKNYTGNHYYRDGQFFREGKKEEINNPLQQRDRHSSLLRQLVAKLGYRYPIESIIVFMHPSFVLYHASADLPIVFLPQLTRHLKELGAQKSSVTPEQQQLAAKLLARHRPDLFPPKVPAYTFASLRKGLYCERCRSFQMIERGHSCVCLSCGEPEKKTSAILRSIREFQLLFPKERLTTAKIYEWCAIIPSMQVIRRVLKANFQEKGANKGQYYE